MLMPFRYTCAPLRRHAVVAITLLLMMLPLMRAMPLAVLRHAAFAMLIMLCHAMPLHTLFFRAMYADYRFTLADTPVWKHTIRCAALFSHYYAAAAEMMFRHCFRLLMRDYCR